MKVVNSMSDLTRFNNLELGNVFIHNGSYLMVIDNVMDDDCCNILANAVSLDGELYHIEDSEVVCKVDGKFVVGVVE